MCRGLLPTQHPAMQKKGGGGGGSAAPAPAEQQALAAAPAEQAAPKEEKKAEPKFGANGGPQVPVRCFCNVLGAAFNRVPSCGDCCKFAWRQGARLAGLALAQPGQTCPHMASAWTAGNEHHAPSATSAASDWCGLGTALRAAEHRVLKAACICLVAQPCCSCILTVHTNACCVWRVRNMLQQVCFSFCLQ